MVERNHADDFIIHKSTFIVKNERKLDDVYKREKKVSVKGISFRHSSFILRFTDARQRHLW